MIDTSRIVPYLEREQSGNPCAHTGSRIGCESPDRAVSVIMIIDRQTLVQIVLLFDIDHNEGDAHVSREENVNLSM